MKKIIFITIALSVTAISVFEFSCNKKETIHAINPAAANKYDTVTSLGQMKSTIAVWNNHGSYTLVEKIDGDIENEKENIAGKLAACSDNFSGSARAAAKTSFSTTASVNYSNVATLRATLQTDNFMRTRGITNSSNRISYEKRNASVTTSYLFAIARESDNDYHMIIGDPSAAAGVLFNCEASGLPASSAASYTAIKTVRSYLKTYFGTDFCGSSGYTKFTPAITVTTLKGSLFFDIDHAAGTVGPSGYRPNTAWEMHPINSIHF